MFSATGIAFSILFLTLTDSNSERAADSSRLSESDPNLKSPTLVTPYTQDDRDQTLTQTGSPDRNSQPLNKMSDRAKIKAKEALHAIASTKQSQNFKKSLQQKAGSSESINSRHINYLNSESAVGSPIIHPEKGWGDHCYQCRSICKRRDPCHVFWSSSTTFGSNGKSHCCTYKHTNEIANKTANIPSNVWSHYVADNTPLSSHHC